MMSEDVLEMIGGSFGWYFKYRQYTEDIIQHRPGAREKVHHSQWMMSEDFLEMIGGSFR